MIAAFTFAILSSPTNTVSQASLQAAMVNFAVGQVGKTVRSGECAELAAEALDQISAKPFGTWEDSPSTGDYVWGKQIATITPESTDFQIEAGDILQFRDVKIVTKTGHISMTYTASQHTAIIESIDLKTGEAKVLQQNSRGRKYVTRDSVSLKDIKRGTIWAYRVQPK